MRKFILVSCLALAFPVAFASAASAAPLTATFKNAEPKKDLGSCGTAFFCGNGTVAGFGSASFVLNVTGAPTPSGRCEEVPATITVTLAGGAGTLDVSGTGLVCFPGRSGDAPGALRSFGNPFRATGTFTVTGGTGAFAGATGTVSGVLRGAGAHVSLKLSGDVAGL